MNYEGVRLQEMAANYRMVANSKGGWKEYFDRKPWSGKVCFKDPLATLQSYSTVTDFARLRGWSTSHPRRTAIW